MISIVGLGNCGCNIAEKFFVYPQYKIYYINTEGQYSGHKTELWPEYSSPERYEENCPDMSSFFEDIDEEVLFIVGGSGYISATALRLLSCIKDKKISILYIKPDVEFLPQTKKLVENCTFHILQEYARSGIFEKMFIFENSSLEKIIGNVTITNFYDKINDHIASAMHMINVFDNTDPVVTSFSELNESSRICTLGVVDIESAEEKLFFLLDKMREKRYYFGVNEEVLRSDESLFGEIKNYLRLEPEDIGTSFSIYSTNYDNSFAYVVCYTSEIQTKKHARVE